MVLICSEPGSRLSAEISHITVLDSWAVELVVGITLALKSPDCNLQVHPVPEEVADTRLGSQEVRHPSMHFSASAPNDCLFCND